jgi:hypothetical protein
MSPRNRCPFLRVAITAASCLFLLTGSSAAADKEKKPRTVQLALRPAAEPVPALRYELLPGTMERKPGNAAVTYLKLGMYGDMPQIEKDMDKIVKFLEMPPDKLPRKEVRELVGRESFLRDLRLAAEREQCDWQLPLREQNPISVLLPELQKLRGMARLLALRARLQTAEGDLAGALESLQTGFSMARHVAQGPTLVNGLVAVSIARTMEDELEYLVQAPGAPNLYWALVRLPQPLVDFHAAMDMEMGMVYFALPELAEIESAQSDPRRSQVVLRKLVSFVTSADEHPWVVSQCDAGTVAVAIAGYPRARQAMIDRGRPAAEVDALPISHVVLVEIMRVYREYRDHVFKWFFVPYLDGQTGMDKTDRLLREEARQHEILPLASLLLPAIANVRKMELRQQRSIALLEAAEALRMHAAAHDGRLPESLADVTVVPVPLDPLNGKPFVYQGGGERAVLESLPTPGLEPELNGPRYEIRMVK